MTVKLAIEALEHFGAVTRESAEKLLDMWSHNDELSEDQREKVLEHFPL